MNNTKSSSKLASIFATVTACLGLTLGASGCYIEGAAYVDEPVVVVDTPPPPPPPAPLIAEIPIDANATMASSPGLGVGLYVEYAQGGRWAVYTTCDTEVSAAACAFDVIISADPSVWFYNVVGSDLDYGDTLELGSDGSIRLVTETTYGYNGVLFDADPGAVVRFDMLLDGVAQPAFVFAVSDGVVLNGVPTNPVDFLPTAF